MKYLPWEQSPQLLRIQRELKRVFDPDDLLNPGKILPPPVLVAATPTGREASRWGEIFEGIYRHRTFAVWAMWFCCFSTTYGLNAWLPTLYRTNFQLPLSQALLYGLITQVVGLVGSTICALNVDRSGRRPWFLFAFIGGGIVLLTLSVVGPSILWADAYATTAYVMGLDGLAWVAAMPGYGACAITRRGRLVTTDRFEALRLS